MSFLTDTLAYIMSSSKKRTYIPPKLNRVDADPKLIKYHETGTGKKPTPQETDFLPLRTRIVAGYLTDMYNAQTHAYYEEIDSIPAASVGAKSEFSAGQWYVIHPVSSVEMLDLNTRVLQDLQEWIETKCPNELFVRKTQQVQGFKKVRSETLEGVKRELRKREARGDIGSEEGYTGDWEHLGEDEEAQEGGKMDASGKGKEKAQESSRHTAAALEEAAEAGRSAAEEAKIRDEFDFGD